MSKIIPIPRRHPTNLQGELTKYLTTLKNTDDQNIEIHCYLNLGCLHERLNDYKSALNYYLEGLKLIPSIENASSSYLRQDLPKEYIKTKYFLNNNAGFCLNTLKRFEEGEAYCRMAIKIQLNRHNAHKNLGISLEGQGRYTEAAKSYINSTITYHYDMRAFMHLNDMLKEYCDLIKVSEIINDFLKCLPKEKDRGKIEEKYLGYISRWGCPPKRIIVKELFNDMMKDIKMLNRPLVQKKYDTTYFIDPEGKTIYPEEAFGFVKLPF
jgi:tetratricopeptide (TPR) repeat protein